MSRFPMIALVLAVTVTLTNGQYFSQGNTTGTNLPQDIYTKGIMNFATSISSGMNFSAPLQEAFSFLNKTSNIVDQIDFNAIFQFLEFAQSRNTSFFGGDDKDLDMLYNMLKFLQFLSTIDDSTMTSPAVEGLLAGMGAGLTEVTRPILENVLENLTLTLGEDPAAIIAEVLGTGPADLQTFLESANLSNMTFDPAAMLTSLGVSSLCLRDLGIMMTSVTQGSMTAIQMLDSMGKLRAGILEGNVFFPGRYDQCLSITPEEFATRYCLVSVPASMQGFPLTMKEGLCVPDTCGESDILVLVNAMLSSIPAGDTPIYASKTSCSYTDTTYDTKAIVALSICGLFAALMVVSTAFDILREQCKSKPTTAEKSQDKPRTIHDVHAPIPEVTEGNKQGEFPSIIYTIDSEEYKKTAVEDAIPKIYPTAPVEEPPSPSPKEKQPERVDGILVKLLLSFSVWTNGRKLLNAEQGGALGAVNGLRFLSMSWVILGHTYSFSMAYIQNFTFFTSVVSRWTFMAIINGLMAVDTFFTMSGLLVAFVFMKEMKKEKGRINWFLFYFHRFWRLTPAYMLILMINATLSRYLGDGPEWPKDGFEIDSCSTTWWTSLLYVNNFVHSEKMCLGVAWYLANDMQFYILSPLMLVPLYFFKKIGVLVCAVFLLGVTVATAIISATYDLPITFVDVAASGDYMTKYYIKPYCRMGPYIVGLVTGYILHEKGLNVKINKYVNFFIWVVASVVACLVVYGIYDSANGDPVSVGVAALYNSTSRSLWGACISWVIFACATGNGGFVNTILSWKPFVPLGRLTYCAYLVHMIIMLMNLMSAREYIYATDKAFIFLFLGYMVMSYMAAFVLSLAFEAPMMALEKVIFRRGGGRKEGKTKK
ncbi:nose resistant to fluoxetine protein 6-like [Pecten maximus]|uniref:nose resistant to fluoxetine protein 6-like n=1 Tax=Pecten maximus TaxID=6579 RepID=UPI0014586D40|nr:nose resistant to fluoxetine protein 6-like [Pecten maximus]